MHLYCLDMHQICSCICISNWNKVKCRFNYYSCRMFCVRAAQGTATSYFPLRCSHHCRRRPASDFVNYVLCWSCSFFGHQHKVLHNCFTVLLSFSQYQFHQSVSLCCCHSPSTNFTMYDPIRLQSIYLQYWYHQYFYHSENISLTLCLHHFHNERSVYNS